MNVTLTQVVRSLVKRGLLTEANLLDEADVVVVDALAGRLAVAERVKAGGLPDEDVATLSLLYEPWRAGEAVKVGALKAWDDTIVECIQAHTTQSDWTPDRVPNLWLIHRATTGTAQPWVAPTAYAIGDRVTYARATYECIQAHTSQAGWNPVAVPALWKLIP